MILCRFDGVLNIDLRFMFESKLGMLQFWKEEFCVVNKNEFISIILMCNL